MEKILSLMLFSFLIVGIVDAKCPPGMKLCGTTILFDLCCPLPMGVCCSDLVHCCPHGYECDLDHQRCNKKNNTQQERPVVGAKFGLKQCGGSVWCAQNDDCCKGENGAWQCCRHFSKNYVYGLQL
nr:progranulin-like [Parasteatoda tepidariorum]